jgi:methylase of polypeptide subunit release factors
MEIGAGQGAAVLDLLERAPGLKDCRIEKDLAGRDRMALARATEE